MENTVLSLFVNGLMAALLLVTILYCWRLNNRIRILQDSRSELARIIREFNESKTTVVVRVGGVGPRPV